MGIVVGIDLGTTFSAVACVGAGGKPRILKNSAGEATTPSVVSVCEDGEVLWGEEAKEDQFMGDVNAASYYKRNMGDTAYLKMIQGRPCDATDLSAMFLKELLADVSSANEVEIDGAVVTVPAYFGARQREATQEALRRTGVRVLGMLNEPSAAAYAYGLVGISGERTVLIYDLGGGTFDVTVARITQDQIEVLASTGNRNLGGRDWDVAITDLLIEKFCDGTGRDVADLSQSESDINTLAVLSERVKRELSVRTRSHVRVALDGAACVVDITRDEFEEATENLLARTEDLCKEALQEAGERLGRPFTWKDLDGVVLVGGSTRMPQVSSFLEKLTGRPPYRGVNPDEAVALGAAVYANQLAGKKNAITSGPQMFLAAPAPRLVDCTAHALGMIAESQDRSRYVNSTIIKKNAAVPASSSKEYGIRVGLGGEGTLEVYLLQGSDQRPLYNDVIGKYVVTGITKEQGESKVRVTYSYTENATVEVTAEQPAFGRSLTVTRAEVEDDLSRFERPPAENDPEPEVMPMRVMIAIDVSGSMYGAGFRAAYDGVKGFLSAVEDAPVKVGLMFFSNSCSIISPMGSSHKSIMSQMDQIKEVSLTGYCPLLNCLGAGNRNNPLGDYRSWLDGRPVLISSGNRGVSKSIQQNIWARHDGSFRDCLLILTDGVWDSRACDEALHDSKALKDDGVIIIGTGVAWADLKFLRSISTSDSYAGLFDFSQLGETFSTIGRSLAGGMALTL